MTKKIFKSIFIVVLVVLLASISLATSFIYDSFNRSQVDQLKEELALVANGVNLSGTKYFDNFHSNSVFRFTVVDANGEVVFDTKVDPSTLENHKDREEIKEALETGAGSSARRSDTFTEKTYYEAVLLEDGNVLRVSVSQQTVWSLLVDMSPYIIVTLLVAAAVTAVLSHGMASKITEPLMQLDLDNPTQNDTYEELTPILVKIHKQHKQIKNQMETLRHKTEEFEQVVSSMTEGLVLLDEHGMVIKMNASARQIFAVKNFAEGSDFLMVDRTSKMSKSIWEALEGQRSEYVEQRNGLEYQFTINPIWSGDKVLGVVILAFDITERVFAERNRKEFTANVTHELKTPLQTIIGSAELLETGLVKPEDTPRFVGNIRKEAKRLVHLINDIIRLSQLDENQSPAMESVDLVEVTNEVLDVLTDTAEQKKVTLEVQGNAEPIMGVRRYVYEIMYNLCENAIRYNKEGGSVTVGLAMEDGHSVVTVKDTGIGIPVEDQPRIFERFYRVDKSHSKETGGTGLGLSIVKHALLFHKATVSLDSEVGKGTTFTIKF